MLILKRPWQWTLYWKITTHHEKITPILAHFQNFHTRGSLSSFFSPFCCPWQHSKVNCLCSTDKWICKVCVFVWECDVIVEAARLTDWVGSPPALFISPFVLVQTTVARDGAELDLLCLETLSVTLALSSEMLSLTSLTYDSSSEPCERNRYTGEWGSAVVQHKRIRTASHSHARVHCSLPLANKLQQHAAYLSHCSNHESRHCSISTLYIANKIRSHLKGPCCSHFGWKLLFQFMWQKKERKGLPLELQARGMMNFHAQ